jgi:hypothetical protein
LLLFPYSVTIHSGRSKNLAQKAVEDVQALQVTLNSYKTRVKKLEESLEPNSDDSDEEDMADNVSSLENARKKIIHLKEIIKRKRTALGVDGRLSLHKLSTNKFLQLRMSARALKSRIRDRLRQRKFELALLERAYRHCTSGKLYTLN